MFSSSLLPKIEFISHCGPMRKVLIVFIFLLMPGILWAQAEPPLRNTPVPTVGQGKKIGISSASRKSSLPSAGQGNISASKDQGGMHKEGQGVASPNHGNSSQHRPSIRVPNSRPGGPITRPSGLPGNRPGGPRQRPHGN